MFRHGRMNAFALVGLSSLILAPSLALAVSCESLWDKATAGVNLLDRDAAAAGGWEIYYFTDCYVRAQNAADESRGGSKGATWGMGAVTDLDWKATEESVTGTINNFFGGSNEKLWFKGSTFALAYWGWNVLHTKPNTCTVHPQSGLNSATTAVSLVLPTGHRKLGEAISEGVEIVSSIRTSENSVNWDRIGGWVFGLNGKLKKEDYAYVHWLDLIKGAFFRFTDSKDTRAYSLGWTNDKNRCVVIDLTQLDLIAGVSGGIVPGRLGPGVIGGSGSGKFKPRAQL